MKNVIICDLDGTLADIVHRRHYVERPVPKIGQLGDAVEEHLRIRDWKPDWDAFHAACVDDTPKEDVIGVVRASVESIYADLWIVSGRSEKVRPQTEAWLKKYVGGYDRLIMRSVGDYTPDDDLKEMWLRGDVHGNNRLLPPKEHIWCVFDDRDRVVAMWRRHGLTCLQVAAGAF